MDGFFGSSGGGNNTQYLVMPTASKSFFDSKTIIQYKGETDETYTNGYFYKCIEVESGYAWQQIYVQPGGVATVVKGVWTATGQTNYSTVPLPATKGWAYLVNGTTTIDSITYTSGDLIVFNKDKAVGSTVVTADLDFMDMDMVTKDNTITLTNKTINVDNNTVTNIEVDNFKTSVIQTTVRAVGVATDTAIATEKAVSDGLSTKVSDVKVNGTSVVDENKVADITIESPIPQVIKPLSVVENVLSANTKFAAKTSNFFVYNNGDVSIDGKTIFKTNPNTISEGDMTAMAGGEDIVMTINYNNFASYGSMEFFRVSENGTITSIRKVSGNASIIRNNSSIRFAGDYVFLYGKPNANEYLYSLAIADIEDTNIWFTKIGNTTLDGFDYDGINYYAARGAFGQPILYYASVDFNTIFDGTPITIASGVGILNYFGIVDNKLSFAYENEIFGTIHYLTQTVHGSGILNTITLPWTKQFNIVKDIQKIADVYYLMAFDEQYTSYTYHTASSLTTFNATADGVGYNVVGKDKNTIITLNSTSILWSGLKDIEYNDFEKLGYSQIADNPISNTDIPTSLFDKSANEYKGNNMISSGSLNIGDVIEVYISGTISTASAPSTNILKITFGGVELVASSKAVSANLVNSFFQIICKIVVRGIGTTGKMLVMGYSDIETISNPFRTLIGTEVEVNTTINSLVDVTYTWGTASADNIITPKLVTMQIKKQW